MQPNCFTAIVARAEAILTRPVFSGWLPARTRHEPNEDEAPFDVNEVPLTLHCDASNEEALDARRQLQWRRRNLRGH